MSNSTSSSSSLLAIEQLLLTMKQLRDPKIGCDWDKKQTFDSIASCTLEETYEVIDAIQRKDYQELKSELGDLLYQIVFYSEMADEKGLFTFNDVCLAINQKLIQRHPHVFNCSDSSLDNTFLDKASWEKNKQKEREQKSLFSVLDDIPVVLPALIKADKIQKRCASVGFDWDTLPPVIAKVHEEINEVIEEIDQPERNQERITEEIGDLLFATVNLSRHLGVKAEQALQLANQKFTRRFKAVEQYLKEKHIPLAQATLDEMEIAWQQVKQSEK